MLESLQWPLPKYYFNHQLEGVVTGVWSDLLPNRDVGNRILSIIVAMFSFKVVSCICHAVPRIHLLDSSAPSFSDDNRENLKDTGLTFRSAQHLWFRLSFTGVLSISEIQSINTPNQQKEADASRKLVLSCASKQRYFNKKFLNY